MLLCFWLRISDVGLMHGNNKMNISWNTIETWIAHFDILGFKNRINYDDQSLLLEILKSSIDDAIANLEKDINHIHDIIEYISYADTFIIYSKATETTGYPELVRASKNFTWTCGTELV